MTDDANDLLMRGGTPSVKFPVLGTSIIGVITKQPKVAEVKDPATGEVKRWPNGDTKKQVIVELQTELRESDDDAGERTLWVKGQMQQAVRDAVRQAGARGLMIGGVIQVTYSADKPNPPLQPQKLFTVVYWPPEQAPVAVQVPTSPWDQPSPAPAVQQTPWQQVEQRQQQQAPAPPQSQPAQSSVGARPVSAPPVNQSFLNRLRQTSANQQQAADQRNAQGQPQEPDPPF